jgi:hypothetical protein
MSTRSLQEQPMSADPPEFTNWQEAWEWHAAQTAAAHDERSAAELLEMVRSGHYDGYYTVWDSIATKSTLAEAAPVLMEVLRRESDDHMDLVRYHCAAALFALLGHPKDDISPLRARVQWQHHGEAARQAALDELEQEIAEQLAHR